MSKTIRKVPKNKWMRQPKFKWKLKAGLGRKKVISDWDDKPIAARKEMKGKRKLG